MRGGGGGGGLGRRVAGLGLGLADEPGGGVEHEELEHLGVVGTSARGRCAQTARVGGAVVERTRGARGKGVRRKAVICGEQLDFGGSGGGGGSAKAVRIIVCHPL